MRQSKRGESLATVESNIFCRPQNSGVRHFCYLIAPSLVWTFRRAFAPAPAPAPGPASTSIFGARTCSSSQHWECWLQLQVLAPGAPPRIEIHRANMLQYGNQMNMDGSGIDIAKVGILGGRVDTRGRRGSRGQGGRQGSRRSRGHGLGAVSSWALPGGASGPAVKAVRLQRGGNLVKI